jgi:flagellar basal-body rod modification protein FlgD
MSTLEHITTIGVGSSPSPGTRGTKSLGKNDFLKILLTQIKNQDPQKPLEGMDFAARLAPFSSLEHLHNAHMDLQSPGLYSMTASNVQAVSLIGKVVAARGDYMVKAAGSPVQMRYELPVEAHNVSVKIYDTAGTVVRTIDGGMQREGVNTVTWDCSGAPPGKYSFVVDARDAEGNAIKASTMITGQVTAVHFQGNAIILTVDGRDIPFSDVVAVKDTTRT